ncbi:hypothetical protein Ddye_016053 [Dipteronia dyeriana]|uniref:Zinc knuckle CX2CX4HX4C domain-containing protein n=1 Tax=Dipteronia dyeriana TaxID=168575 RepID=A0AAD9U6K8_9ROSI|nr:hypothetical protein Ddye_016053 [Dipteronia dyeriana]
MRMKVQIDINKPLKRWLRLKLDKLDDIVVVGLKYERLLEFFYACRKIGHGIKKCMDMDAGTKALEGKIMKFGSWMRAPISDRAKGRYQHHMNESSTDRERMMEGSREEKKGHIDARFILENKFTWGITGYYEDLSPSKRCHSLYLLWHLKDVDDLLWLDNPNTSNDFLPIALCSMVYKTVAKMLTARFKSLMPGLISSHQSTFILWRLAFDYVMVAFESLYSIAQKKVGKKGLMAFKLDMTKAYDRVE